jgi:hypothetical protein
MLRAHDLAQTDQVIQDGFATRLPLGFPHCLTVVTKALLAVMPSMAFTAELHDAP